MKIFIFRKVSNKKLFENCFSLPKLIKCLLARTSGPRFLNKNHGEVFNKGCWDTWKYFEWIFTKAETFIGPFHVVLLILFNLFLLRLPKFNKFLKGMLYCSPHYLIMISHFVVPLCTCSSKQMWENEDFN